MIEASPRHVEAVDRKAELARGHARSFGWALSCCGWDRAEAEDTLQIAYLKVLDGRARFTGRSSFRTFLFGVIRRTAAERRRRQRRSLSWHRRAAAREADAPAPATSESDAARLRAELGQLPPRQREVLHLVFYGDLSIREASQVMNVSLGTARVHYERGKRRLRERLGLGVGS